MKKSLKALFLCALTSLVMFAAVYVSPISVQAVPSTLSDSVTISSITVIDENWNTVATVNSPVQIDFEYPNGTNQFTLVSSTSYCIFDPNEGFHIFAEFDNTDVNVLDAQMLQNVIAGYNFSYNGVNYSGSISLYWTGGYGWEGYLIWRTDDFATGYVKELNDLKNSIGNISKSAALTGENRVIEFDAGDSLPGDVIAVMANSNDVTLKFTFVYKGYEFCTTITSEDAKRLNDPSISWWGPCYLAEHFPTVWTGKTV